MHKFFLILTFSIFHSVGAGAQVPCQVEEQQSLEVMTYNIRLDVTSDGVNAWPNRRNLLAIAVRDCN